MELQAACFKRAGQRIRRFKAVDDAIEWLKRNYEVVVVGAVVVIGGVAFVVVVAGSGGGALVLAPALLLASPDLADGSPIAEMSR